MRIKLNLLLLLSIFWLGINGVSTSANGVIISLLMILAAYVISQYLNIIPNTSRLKYNFLIYLLWLYNEILKSTFDVIKRVWRKNPCIEPTFKWVDSGNIEDAGLTIYSNSITLTPGTLVLDIDNEKRALLIHALEASLINDLETGIMLKKIKQTIVCQNT